ncbi:alpha/beta hydrolase [Massilia sp. P8910]|uniref:alpha/beta fold hydrolase n=1 Tax=Massilia antarctica TaxID=2765360 RepID=UPI001E621DA1|nr:alpha/beta hydrolase [Massilia antarctica]MCE3604667.1 alpha/beta hydrolase [Massilia antarctica]
MTEHQRPHAAMATLVLLPGMDGSGDLFAGFVSALGDRVEAIVISYPPALALGYAGLTEHARAQLPLDRPFVLLGESFSGPVAIALAAARPPGLIGLVLCCTFARTPRPLLAPLRPVVSLLPMSSKLTVLIAPFLLGFGAPLALRRALRRALDQVPQVRLRLRLREVMALDYTARARTIAVPVLYLQATRDCIVPAAAARLLASLCPDWRLVALRGPHLLLQTVPAQAATTINDFVATLAVERTS